MKALSVILVNYNVKHFLEQALHSIAAALEDMDGEVIVVDNNSVDGSVRMLREQFPWVRRIENAENVGFSRANNQAIRAAEGRYVLLLNPDTIVEEDTFSKCVAFMDAHPEAGAVGVRMVDGEGNFQPQSKRSLPTPWRAFYKVFGLSKLFPKSKRFGRYHLSYLDPNETHEVEVLSGAFMMLRRSLLAEIGLLDEAFFMYGEDIDLSYRITQAGYKNYYYADTRIIHYKGESTKKGSLNYVLVFYKAMLIFVRKHFSRGPYAAMQLFLTLAIYLRAGLAISRRLAQRMVYPVGEGLLLTGLFAGLAWGWLQIHPAEVPGWYYWAGPAAYALVFVVANALWGNYRRPFRIRALFGAAFTGFLALVVLTYVFKQVNFSRMIVGLSAVGALMAGLAVRAAANKLHSGSLFLDQKARSRLVIIGDRAEAARVQDLLVNQVLYNCEIIGYMAPTGEPGGDEPYYLGDLNQLGEVVRFYAVEELVFCNASLPTQRIIAEMSRMADQAIQYKIVPPAADYLVGPNTILSSAHMTPALQHLGRRDLRRQKQAFDLLVGAGLLGFFPLTFWIYQRPGAALRTILHVLRGNCHWVGYIEAAQQDLPPLKPGLLDMRLLDDYTSARQQRGRAAALDRQYAYNYSLSLDLQILWRGLRQIGTRGEAAA